MRISMSTIDEVRATDAGGSALVAPRVLAMVGGSGMLSDLRAVRPSWTDVSTLDVVDTEELDVFAIDWEGARGLEDHPPFQRLVSRLPTLLIVDAADADGAGRFASRTGIMAVAHRPHCVPELPRRLAALSELRRLRRALKVTEAALQNSVTGLAISDPNKPGNPLVYVSPTFERMTGYRADEVIGRNCRFLQGGASSPEAIEKLRRATAESRTAHVVIENYRKDGSTFWNDLTIFPIRDEDGRHLYYGGVQHDVTELFETRAELADARQELDDRHAFTLAILEGLQVAIVTTDARGIVTFINPAACAVIGAGPEVCLGRSAESVLQLPSAAREWVATRVPGSMRVEYVIRAEGGTTREVGASIRLAEYSREGIGHFFVFRDLAETRQSERIERLAAVSTMAAGFAHEVRNPLASVRMFGELLLAELDASGEHHDIVGRMLSQVNRIERLVRTSLRLARPERPRKGHHWPSVIVNATLEALVPRLRDMKGELDVRVEEGLPRVLCDDAQAVQILVILITNALDATQDPSGVLLRVGTRREPTDFDSPARRVVVFSVVDTGPGVPEHLRASIFHPFFTTKAQGTGLGLSIAQQIAHENGGRIELVPGDGGGSIFTLIVPTEVTE